MSERDAIEAREGTCKTAADFAALARETAALDADYARSLLEKAEAQCQMPPDYLAAAEGAVALGLADYARDLYGQAEDACFDALEKAALGASLARTGTDPAKGRALLDEAAGEAKQLNELLTISGYAKEALGDEALAASLLARVETKVKGLPDYLDLARTLKAQGAEAAARDFYKKAARHLDGMADTVAYAKGYLAVFADQAAARKVLEDAETDCQFPKDFAALAAGFKELFDDNAKVSALMEQAAEFAMSGEEHLDLARGYWDLLGDQSRAVAAFAKALPEVNDKGQLLDLAGFIAAQVGDADLAKRFYAKAEEKLASAAERIKLAEAVLRDTGDKAYAAAVYGRAADSLTQPNDLMSVAANLVDQLGDRAAAGAIYRKAMAAMGDLGQYTRLLEAVDARIGDKAFGREILGQARQLASGTPELLDLARRAIASLGDKDLARELLATAEEQVTSVGEMKNVVAAVKEHFADRTDWMTQVEEKLSRREANQAKYAVFQEREKAAGSSIKTLQLADAVMAELDDRFYAQKLLVDAQKRLEEEGWDFSKARKLVEGVSRHLGDSAWAERLLTDAGERAQGFANLMVVAESAAELLPDRDQARVLVKDLLDGFAQRLTRAGVYDLSKLAAARGRLLGDTAGAAATLEQATGQATSHFHYAELARVARELGLSDQVRNLTDQAAARCADAAQARQLAARLLENGFDRDQVKTLYGAIKSRLTQAADRLAWADAIVDLFGDRAWAKQELDELAHSAQGHEAALITRRARQRGGHATA
jgi:hypothetical protein